MPSCVAAAELQDPPRLGPRKWQKGGGGVSRELCATRGGVAGRCRGEGSGVGRAWAASVWSVEEVMVRVVVDMTRNGATACSRGHATPNNIAYAVDARQHSICVHTPVRVAVHTHRLHRIPICSLPLRPILCWRPTEDRRLSHIM